MNFHKFSNGVIVNLDFVSMAVRLDRLRVGSDEKNSVLADCQTDTDVLALLNRDGDVLAEVPACEFESMVAEEKDAGDMFRPFERAVRDFCAAVTKDTVFAQGPLLMGTCMSWMKM